MEKQVWEDLSRVYAVVGNCLLSPLRSNGDQQRNPRLWEDLPCFGDEGLRSRLDELACFLRSLDDEDVVELAAEWTHLFIGPPQPACPPWETYYRREGVTSGFGAATFEMNEILRKLGYAVSKSDNQFADHFGFELLTLSLICDRRARLAAEIGSDSLSDEVKAMRAACGIGCEEFDDAFVRDYIRMHPGFWAASLADDVKREAPRGFYALLLAYAADLLAWHEARL